jgi:hypothetical protein
MPLVEIRFDDDELGVRVEPRPEDTADRHLPYVAPPVLEAWQRHRDEREAWLALWGSLKREGELGLLNRVIGEEVADLRRRLGALSALHTGSGTTDQGGEGQAGRAFSGSTDGPDDDPGDDRG